MKTFVSTYSLNSKMCWVDDIISSTNPKIIKYNKIFNGMIYNIENNNIHYIKVHNNGANINLFYYNKYKTIEYDKIIKLPFDTEFYITKEVEGASYFVTKKNNKTIFYSKYNYKIDNSVIKNNQLCKYLIDKYCDKYIVEFKINNNEIYIVNMFSEKEILPINKIVNIAEHFNMKTPTIINPTIFKYSIDMINSHYNSYYYNMNNVYKSSDYLLTFRFRNDKYLLYKVII